MERLSSSLTLMFKFFIPVFWICFFGAFTMAVWISNENVGPLGFLSFKLGLTAFFLLGTLLLALTLLRLKRVEADGEFLYVTNYFKTARYPHSALERIGTVELYLRPLIFFRLKDKGIFGRRFFFLASRRNWKAFLEAVPEFGEKVKKPARLPADEK